MFFVGVFLFLASILTQLPAHADRSLQPLTPWQCPQAGHSPALLTAVGPELTDSNAPVPGTPLSVAAFAELYLICQSAGQDRALQAISISTLRMDGTNLARDPNPMLLSFDKLRSSGHTYYRSVPFYGSVLVSQMFCPECRPQGTGHHFRIRLLRKFSLFGSSYHDYREIPFSMTYQENSRQYLADRGGTPFQLAISYPGSWGVDRIAFAQCRSGDPIACLRDPKATMVITEVLSLGSQKSVRVE
jgi:hypothetical protein